jgi:hypothetical protein
MIERKGLTWRGRLRRGGKVCLASPIVDPWRAGRQVPEESFKLHRHAPGSPGATYHYVVTAVNVGGESGPPNELAMTPQSK